MKNISKHLKPNAHKIPKQQLTVPALTIGVCQLDVDTGSSLDWECITRAVGKTDVWVKPTDIDWSSACLSDCCSQLCIMSRLLSTSGDGKTPVLFADTTTLALLDLAFVKLPSTGCSRASSVTITQATTTNWNNN